MDTGQRTPQTSDGLLRHKLVLRQSPPGPVALTAASTTQTIFLFGLPAKHVIVGVVARLVTQFTAFGMSLCTVTVGTTSQLNSGITSLNFYMPTFSVSQTVSPTALMYWSPYTTYVLDPQDIKATFVSTGAQLTTVTAGELELSFMYRSL